MAWYDMAKPILPSFEPGKPLLIGVFHEPQHLDETMRVLAAFAAAQKRRLVVGLEKPDKREPLPELRAFLLRKGIKPEVFDMMTGDARFGSQNFFRELSGRANKLGLQTTSIDTGLSKANFRIARLNYARGLQKAYEDYSEGRSIEFDFVSVRRGLIKKFGAVSKGLAYIFAIPRSKVMLSMVRAKKPDVVVVGMLHASHLGQALGVKPIYIPSEYGQAQVDDWDRKIRDIVAKVKADKRLRKHG